jgi:hypothetical protein
MGNRIHWDRRRCIHQSVLAGGMMMPFDCLQACSGTGKMSPGEGVGRMILKNFAHVLILYGSPKENGEVDPEDLITV